jgi:hypothetical protein
MPSASIKRITYIYFSRCARVYRKYSTLWIFRTSLSSGGERSSEISIPSPLFGISSLWGIHAPLCNQHNNIAAVAGPRKKREEEEGKVRKEYFISEHRHTHKMENFLSAGNNITCGEGLCPTSWVVNESSWPTTWPSIHAEHTHTE